MLTFLIGCLGLWMVLAPYIGLTPTDHAWNNWIVGVVIVAASLVEVQKRQSGATAVVLILGIWLVLSGFVPTLHQGTIRDANDLIVGVMMLSCGAAAGKLVRSRAGQA
jgi:uncharacterized membrane protein HdeD (DUF308 family)